MHLYLTETFEQAEAIVTALSGESFRERGFFRVGEQLVAWTNIHLLQPASPEYYDEKYKQWNLNDLPIIPSQWGWEVRRSGRHQLDILSELLRRVDTVIYCSPPDEESQIRLHEILHYLAWRGTTHRVVFDTLTPSSLRHSLEQSFNHSVFSPYSSAGLARHRTDWLLGINVSRALTLRAREQGIASTLTAGRVQTPLLSLIVQHDRAIEQFEIQQQLELEIDITDHQGGRVRARLKQDGSLLSKSHAETIQLACSGKPATLIERIETPMVDHPPTTLNITGLIAEMCKEHGLTAEQTVEAARHLFVAHQLISYPLVTGPDDALPPSVSPDDVNQTVNEFLTTQGLTPVDPLTTAIQRPPEQPLKQYMICPTGKPRHSVILTKEQALVYDTIVKYVATHQLGVHRAVSKHFTFDVEGYTFEAAISEEIDLGWYALFNTTNDNRPAHPTIQWHNDTPLWGQRVHIEAKRTKAPKYYNDGEALRALEHVEYDCHPTSPRRVQSLATEAARANVIETLIKRGYVLRAGKFIMATELGRELVDALPNKITSLDYPKQWMSQFDAIRGKRVNYETVFKSVCDSVTDLIEEASSASLGHLSHLIDDHRCPLCKQSLVRIRTHKKDWLWRCENTQCSYRATDRNGIPGNAINKKPSSHERHCPKCDANLVKREGKHGEFWGCETYPSCDFTQSVKHVIDLKLR